MSRGTKTVWQNVLSHKSPTQHCKMLWKVINIEYRQIILLASWQSCDMSKQLPSTETGHGSVSQSRGDFGMLGGQLITHNLG